MRRKAFKLIMFKPSKKDQKSTKKIRRLVGNLRHLVVKFMPFQTFFETSSTEGFQPGV